MPEARMASNHGRVTDALPDEPFLACYDYETGADGAF